MHLRRSLRERALYRHNNPGRAIAAGLLFCHLLGAFVLPPLVLAADQQDTKLAQLPTIPDLPVRKKYTIHVIAPPSQTTPPAKQLQTVRANKTAIDNKSAAKAPPAAPLAPSSQTTKTLTAIPDLPVPGKAAVEEKADLKLDAKADPKGVLNQALKAYQDGHYGQAAAILATDLQANPNDGTVHYYMGLALKKQGADMPALHELEKAARLCPPELIKKFADEQIGNLDEPQPIGAPTVKTPAASGDWLSNLGSGINQMFGSKPTVGAGTESDSKTTRTSTTGDTIHGGSFFPAMPDLMEQIRAAVKQGKTMLKASQGKSGSESAVDFSRSRSGEAEVMHMAEMQALVAKSHAIGVPEWASSSEGLVAYPEAPENTPEWDYWIGRFKRSFQHVLLRRLNAEAKDQVRGAAACIFSLDRQGNLRGQVYASTADPALNKCLVEAIRDINHSRILAFPATSRINGWNFQMSGNFGVYLAIVRAYRKQKEKQEEKREELETAARLVQQQAEAKARLKATKEKIALAKKLAAEKALKARMLQATAEAKTEVSGQVLTGASERELKAVALELKDLTPVSGDGSQPNVDPFAAIDDHTINSWPDLNR